MEDRARAAALFEEYRDRIFRYLLHRVKNYHEAEDLLSEVSLRLVGKLGSYDPSRGSESTWIYAITRNVVNDYFRHKRDTSPLLEEVVAAREGEPEAQCLSEERLGELARALRQLPERERDVLILRYYSEYSCEKVAACMKLSSANVRVIQHRALVRLQSLLDR